MLWQGGRRRAQAGVGVHVDRAIIAPHPVPFWRNDAALRDTARPCGLGEMLLLSGHGGADPPVVTFTAVNIHKFVVKRKLDTARCCHQQAGCSD